MADYINKNEVLNLIMHNNKVEHYADIRYENIVYETACRISDAVAEMPAADVQLKPIKNDSFFDRLLNERDELCDRISSLDFFIKVSPKYRNLKVCQRGALVRQLDIMKQYRDILNFRIEDIKNDMEKEGLEK